MFGFRRRGGLSERIIDEINPNNGNIPLLVDDMAVASTTRILTTEALIKSGFSERDARSPLAYVAATYASHILLAELRYGSRALPEGEAALSPDAMSQAYMVIRERLGIPRPEPMSDEEVQRLMDMLNPNTAQSDPND
jgi:hypothetical protein